jgi:hypothetical protein
MSQNIFPEIICSGGLQAMVGAMLDMNRRLDQVLDDTSLVLASGCLDAPNATA